MLLGCSSQASPDYVGKALITLRGSVKIEEAPEGTELRPALAFFNGETGRVQIVDVEVEGEFPSDFTLRVTQPPPEAAFFAGPDGIDSALGYITAVTADHPDSFPYATRGTGSIICYEEPDLEDSYCEGQRYWCTGEADDQNCYGELQRCPDSRLDGEDCAVIDRTGDRALKDTWASFAGLSEDLVLVYLSEPLDAGAKDAIRLGLPGLPAGYALLEPQPAYDPDDPEEADCDTAIERRATELYEEEYEAGITYDYLIAQGGCGGENKEEWIPCDPRRDRIWRTIHDEFMAQAEAEIGCRPTGTWRRVEHPEDEHIAMRIGTDVRPSLFAPDRVSDTQQFAPSLTFESQQTRGVEFSDPCAESEAEAVAWDEQSPSGQTPEAAFGALEEGCVSTLTWDSSESERVITPSSGETEIIVELKLDRDSARHLTFPDPDRCAARLEITAELTLRTTDGAIADTSEVDLIAGQTLFLLRELSENGGSLDLDRDKDEQVFVEYRVAGAGDQCTGQVGFFVVEEPEGVTFVGALSGRSYVAGSWSNNGCFTGQRRISADEPLPTVGASPRELVEDMFGTVEASGKWRDNGESTDISLSATFAQDSLCTNNGRVDAPAHITYSTSDGTITEHVGDGFVDLDWTDPDRPEGRLFVSDELRCQSRDDVLAYTPAQCEQELSVMISLGVVHDGRSAEARDELSVYTFDRGGLLDRLGVDGELEQGFRFESADHRRSLELE